ncbi:hypothetical protein ACOMHN_043403 [Nucella lapillus]
MIFFFYNGCGVECRPDQLSFYIRTGVKNAVGPTVCFEGNVIVSNDLKNFGRGLNFVILHSITLEVKEVRAFDTYLQDTELIRFLKKGVSDDNIVIIVSFDEASSGLREDARKWLKRYGSDAIDSLAFRDSIIMIGQKGLQEGHAIEYVSKKDKSEDFSAVLEKAGCFSLPLGPRDSLQVALPNMLQGVSIAMGEALAYCGLPGPCADAHTVAIGVFSGNQDKKPPFVCVDGRIVITDNVNKGGRGFNIVALKSASLKPVSVMHADTYSTDSTDLELYLESLALGDIIVAVVADDGAKKLSYSARDLLNTLGSGYIQNLRFRDVWFFVGQKGIQGFTTMEQVSYAGYDGDWPKPINKSYCVPRKLVGRKIIPDPEFYRFDERRDFCKKYDGYPEFCDPSRVDDKLKTVGTADRSLQGHAIFDTPLVIVPGLNHNALVRTLETTLMQPGIEQKNVVVMWDKKFPEHGELATLFGFSNVSLPSTTQYIDQMGHALKHSVNLFPKAEHFIVVEEELLLAPDFLSFLAQCFSTLNSDPTLLAVSAWNYNGFERTSGNRQVVYRVEEFPGLGFLAKKKAMNTLIASLPHKRAWHGWKYEGEGHFEILVPDMSRVFRQPFKAVGQEMELVTELFLHPRTTSLEQAAALQNLGELMERQYEEYLHGLIADSIPLTLDDLKQCVHSLEPPPDFPKTDKRSVAVYFDQDSSLDYKLFGDICRCFGLVSPRNWRPKNLHNGMLRFWYQDRHVFLIGSATAYYKNKSAAKHRIKPPHIS